MKDSKHKIYRGVRCFIVPLLMLIFSGEVIADYYKMTLFGEIRKIEKTKVLILNNKSLLWVPVSALVGPKKELVMNQKVKAKVDPVEFMKSIRQH